MKETENEMRKVFIPGESFWVEVVEDDDRKPYYVGIVANNTINGSYVIGDKVTVLKSNDLKTNNTILGILKKSSLVKYCIKYPTTGDIEKLYKDLTDKLRSHGCETEGLLEGTLLIGAPKDLDVEECVSEFADVEIVIQE